MKDLVGYNKEFEPGTTEQKYQCDCWTIYIRKDYEGTFLKCKFPSKILMYTHKILSQLIWIKIMEFIILK